MSSARHGRKCSHYDCDETLQARGDRYWCHACDRKYADLVLQDTGQDFGLLPGPGEFFACPLCAYPMLLQMDTYDQLFYWHCDVCDMSRTLTMLETVHRTAIPIPDSEGSNTHADDS